MIPYFEMGIMGGHFNSEGRWNHNLLSMIDTETKQLQCISDLYAIVKAQPAYKKMNDPNWKEKNTPLEIIAWLLRKLSPLAKGAEWNIDIWKDGNKTRYRFVVYKHYSSYIVRNYECFVPMDFLPRLKKKDEPLHDLIIDTIALTSKMNNIPLWDEDGDFSQALNQFLSDAGKIKDRGNYVLAEQYAMYKTGDAAQYLKLFKERRKIVTVPSVKAKLKRYKATSRRKQILCYYLESGIKMAATRDRISNYDYVPAFIGRKTISGPRLYKPVWSVKDIDPVKARVWKNIDSEAKFGYFFPLSHVIIKPGEIIKPLIISKFPVHLFHFMDGLYKHFHGAYYPYYFGRPKKDKDLQPGEQMLDAIERAELRNEIINS